MADWDPFADPADDQQAACDSVPDPESKQTVPASFTSQLEQVKPALDVALAPISLHTQLESEVKPALKIDPSLVKLAADGDDSLGARIRCCEVDVVAFEYKFYPGSERMFCTEWTPLTAAAAAGHVAAVKSLLQARADANALCCCCTSSGAYSFWTALDCARTAGTMPCERDPEKHKQPRHPVVARLLLAAGALPSSKLPAAPPMNTYGNTPEDGQKPNPCLDDTGFPFRPTHLYDEAEEEEKRRAPGKPKFSALKGGGGGGCPMTSMGCAERQTEESERVYTGGARVFKLEHVS